MTRTLALALVAATALAASATAALADDALAPKQAGHILLQVRVTDVAPDAGNAITAAGAPTGLKADVSDSYVPTLGIDYFFTDHIAAELVLGTSYHKVKADGPGTNVEVHDTWVVPPVLTLQYHFMPKARFSPYLGAGVNYMLFYSGKDKNGFTVKLKDGAGAALQAGFDYGLGGRWSANVDVKKVYFNTKATINGGALASSVDLNPWVISAGVGYRF